MQSLIIYLRYGCKNALNYEDAYKITDIMEKFGILMGNDNISKIIGFTKEIISCVTNGPDALRSLEIEVGLGGSCDDTCNGIILSVPANETVLESINNLDSDYGYYATYYTKPLFSKLPQTLLVHLIHNSKEEHNCMTHPEDTLPLRNNAISTKGEEPPEAYDNYRLKGVITRTELDGKTEYSSYIKGIQGKWIDFNEEPTSMNNIFRPRTKPLILMYTRPFIAGIDENTFYDSKKTLTEPCDNGSVTVKFLDILTNWPLIAHLDDERKRRDYLKKAASPERFHHFLQMLDINENPEGIIKYLLYTTAVNENAICIEGEEWMNSFTKRINSNPRWRKALLAAIKERYIFSFWETCKNEKLLGGITDLCTEAVVSECLQYREFYELVTQLVEYCTNHKECFGCLLMIQKLWKNDDRNKTILCDTELYAALAKTIIENKESKREVEKKTTEIATDLITQFIIFILRLEKVNAQDKEEFNRTLFRDNTIREILEINKDQEACKQLIKCVTNNNKIALLQMASIIVELLYLSKSVEDDTRIFSFIDAYIGTEDGFTDVRKRLVVTPNLFPKYGILAVYHRAREMSLDRLTLYTNFLIKLDPDQLSHWKPDIAALNNILMCKLEIIIDKKIVYEALTECESRYMRSQEDHKNWLMEIKGFKALGEKDKDLLEQVVRFKENVSNPILLQKIPKETTKTRTKNTFSKTILAALAAQSNNTNDKFLNTTEGLVVVYKLFSQSQK